MIALTNLTITNLTTCDTSHGSTFDIGWRTAADPILDWAVVSSDVTWSAGRGGLFGMIGCGRSPSVESAP